MIKTLRKFFAFSGEENKKKFELAIVLGVLSAFFLALKIPAAYVVIKDMLDGTLTKETGWIGCGIIVLSILLQTVINMKATMLQTEAGYHAAARKRIEIAEHLRYVPMGYFNEKGLGSIASVATNTMENLANVGTRVVMMVTKGYITTAVIITMLFAFDWRIAFVALLGFVIAISVSAVQQKIILSHSAKKLNADEAMLSKVLEYTQGIAEVKNFNLFGSKITEVNATVDHVRDVDFAMEKPAVIIGFIQNVTTKLTGVAIALLSIAFYLNGSMSLIYCIMMILCSFMIFEALDVAGTYGTLLRVIDMCVDLGSEAMSAPTMEVEGKEIAPESSTLVMSGVDFSYDTRKIIDNVSLVIPEKKATAIVGPSGGGKTTLTHLLARFWDVDKGSVTLGGVNVKDYSYDSLMQNFSFVFQNVYLFNDTIANNIRFGKPDTPMEKVIAAAKKACCHDFIMRLPKGYETIIGEGGASLSGGEKQRISIARAIMKNSPIIILDEATANVDPENEQELVRAIEALTKEKTVIMIAHRLKTVQNADQILVIDRGKVVQCGKHDELMLEEGIYRNFVRSREKAASWKIHTA